jgi:hypothetical protein
MYLRVRKRKQGRNKEGKNKYKIKTCVFSSKSVYQLLCRTAQQKHFKGTEHSVCVQRMHKIIIGFEYVNQEECRIFQRKVTHPN